MRHRRRGIERGRALDGGAQAAPLVGRRLGRWELVSVLGSGGMAEVYLARDETLERNVSLKVLPADLADQAAVAAAILTGAHIVRVHDVAPMRDVVRLADAIRGDA